MRTTCEVLAGIQLMSVRGGIAHPHVALGIVQSAPRTCSSVRTYRGNLLAQER
jgi:hypothetical protein